jgi:hypothetical protein
LRAGFVDCAGSNAGYRLARRSRASSEIAALAPDSASASVAASLSLGGAQPRRTRLVSPQQLRGRQQRDERSALRALRAALVPQRVPLHTIRHGRDDAVRGRAPPMLLWLWLGWPTPVGVRDEHGDSLGQSLRKLRLRWLWLGLGSTFQLGIPSPYSSGLPLWHARPYPIFVHPEELLHARESLIKRYCS